MCCGQLVGVNGCLPRLSRPRCAWLGKRVALSRVFAAVLHRKQTDIVINSCSSFVNIIQVLVSDLLLVWFLVRSLVLIIMDYDWFFVFLPFLVLVLRSRCLFFFSRTLPLSQPLHNWWLNLKFTDYSWSIYI